MHVCLQLANSVYSSCSVFLLFWVIFGLIKLIPFLLFFPSGKSGFCYFQRYDNNISFSEVIKQKGLENVTVDDLVAEITPQGRGEIIIIYISFESLASLHISLASISFWCVCALKCGVDHTWQCTLNYECFLGYLVKSEKVYFSPSHSK